ncbi:MAG: TlpA disulfide reductase family protein [Bryobacteraceae bacterium]|nr:TlpA disulfide reductase family protein [Bryobacteraceae bacterium]
MKLLLATLLALPVWALPPVDEASYPKLVSQHKGKVLLVNFWATWCVPCRKEMPELARIEARLKAKGLTLVTVSADEPEQEAAAQKFLAQYKLTGPAYLKRAKDDDKFIALVDAKWSGALPALALYDKSGKKVRVWVGESDLKAVEAAILKLL